MPGAVGGGILNWIHDALNAPPPQPAANFNGAPDPTQNTGAYSAPAGYGAPAPPAPPAPVQQAAPPTNPVGSLNDAFTRDRIAADPSLINDPRYAKYLSAQNSASTAASGNAANPNGDQLAQYGQKISDGALSNIDRLQLQQQQDAQAKTAAIQNAMNILKASQSGQINLPLLAFAGAVGAPTRTGGFAEAISNGIGAATPVLENQRTMQARLAEAQGNLGIQAADVPLQATKDDLAEWNDRLKVGMQGLSTADIVGGRTQVAGINAEAKLGTAGLRAITSEQDAQIARGGKIDVAYINANKNSVEYLGQDSTDPTRGVYLNKNFGTVNYGPLIQNYKGTDPAVIKEADALMKANPKMFPDLPTAFSYVKSGIQTPAEFGKEVGIEKALLVKQGADPSDPTTENAAREQVIARQQLLKQAQGGGGAPQAPAATQVPTPAPAAPAAAPGQPAPPAAAPAAPQVRKALPQEIESAQRALGRGIPREQIDQLAKQQGIELPPNIAPIKPTPEKP